VTDRIDFKETEKRKRTGLGAEHSTISAADLDTIIDNARIEDGDGIGDGGNAAE